MDGCAAECAFEVEAAAFAVGGEKHLGKCLGVAGGDGCLIGNEFVGHFQLAADEPVDGVDPEQGGEELCEDVVDTVPAADVGELVLYDFFVEMGFGVGVFLPEQEGEKGEGGAGIVCEDQGVVIAFLAGTFLCEAQQADQPEGEDGK